MGGVLSVRQCFADDPEIARLADAIYRRARLRLDAATAIRRCCRTAGGRRPGMIVHRWDAFSEAMMLYLLGIGSPTHPLPAASWRAWGRPTLTWDGVTLRHARRPAVPAPVLARVDRFPRLARSGAAARLVRELGRPRRARTSASACRCAIGSPATPRRMWGITASDARKGYKAWGGPPHDPQVDGTVVPCAAAGSLMFDAGHHAAGAARDAARASAIASTAAMASPTRSIRPTAGSTRT